MRAHSDVLDACDHGARLLGRAQRHAPPFHLLVRQLAQLQDNLLAELDVAAYVINCAPNMTPALIAERAGPLVRQLRKAHPETPILLVGKCFYQAGYFLPASRNSAVEKNNAVRKAYENLKAAGVGKLSYVDGMALYGDDGEATVDGTHATDLGFMRAADALEPALRKALDL